MRRAIRAIAAACVLAAGSITAFVVAGPAQADTQICEQFGTTTIGNRYVVMNNRWGTSAQQCINVTGTGFSVLEVIETARSVTGREIPYRVVARRAADPPRLVSGGSRTHDLLGWTPRRASLRDVIGDAWRFHRAQAAGYAAAPAR